MKITFTAKEDSKAGEKSGSFHFIDPFSQKRIHRALPSGMKTQEEVEEFLEIASTILEEYSYRSYLTGREKLQEERLSIFYPKEVVEQILVQLKNSLFASGGSLLREPSPELVEMEKNLPVITMVGETGSGKTTLLRKLISCEVQFLATLQGYSTVGGIEVIVYPETDPQGQRLQLPFQGTCAFFSLDYLLENYGERVARFTLENPDKTIQDKKSIFEYLEKNKRNDLQISRLIPDKAEDLSFLQPSKLKNEANSLWLAFQEDLKQKKETDPILLQCQSLPSYEALLPFFQEGQSLSKSQFRELFYEFSFVYYQKLWKSKEKDSLVIALVSHIFACAWDKVSGLLSLLHSSQQPFTLTILSEEKEYLWTENSPCPSVSPEEAFVPRLAQLELPTQQGDLDSLRSLFFQAMCFITSSGKKVTSLMPLLNRIRIAGIFKSGFSGGSKPFAGMRILDTQGLQHSSTGNQFQLSGGLRLKMEEANLIILVEQFANKMTSLKHLLYDMVSYTDLLQKTCLWVNRLPEDSESDPQQLENEDFEEGKNATRKYLMNCFEDIELEASKHKYNTDSLAGQRDLLLDTMVTTACLNRKDVSATDFSLEKGLSSVQLILDQKLAWAEALASCTGEALSVPVIYGESALEQALQESLVEYLQETTDIVNTSHWATVKALCLRVSMDWNQREWGGLAPERRFHEIVSAKVSSLLAEPVNKEEVMASFYQKIWYINSKEAQMEHPFFTSPVALQMLEKTKDHQGAFHAFTPEEHQVVEETFALFLKSFSAELMGGLLDGALSKLGKDKFYESLLEMWRVNQRRSGRDSGNIRKYEINQALAKQVTQLSQPQGDWNFMVRQPEENNAFWRILSPSFAKEKTFFDS